MNDLVIGSARDGSGDIVLDLDTFIGGHLCVSANSGGGKSGAIRKILEATHGKIQQIILDREDEFYTLREKYDYLIAGGDNGDCIANVNNARALAMTTLKAGISAIFQINSLGTDAATFVAEFLGALADAPRSLWRPLLIVIDEAQLFAPENGGAASKSALISFMMIARKRGFTVILATPRAADLSKQATSPVNNWLLGRAGQPADRRSSADALGFTANSEEARGLRKLEARNFWAFGPALTLEPTLVKIGATDTTIVKAGQATLPTPPAPAAMKAMLAELNAAARDQENEDAQSADAKGKSTVASNGVKEADPAVLAAAESRGYLSGIAAGRRHITGLMADLRHSVDAALAEAERLCELSWDQAQAEKSAAKSTAPIAVHPSPAASAPPPAKPLTEGVTGPMQAVLNSLATWQQFGESRPDNTKVAFLAGYSPTSTSYTKARGALKSAGYVDYPQPDIVALTDIGQRAAQAEHITDIPAMIRPKLTGPELAIFDVMIMGYPGELNNASASQRSGYTATSTSYTKARGALKSKGLITYPGPDRLRAEDWLFAAGKARRRA